jgi:hypothetical protein
MQTGFSSRISQQATLSSRADSTIRKSSELRLDHSNRRSGIAMQYEKSTKVEEALIDLHEIYRMGSEDIVYYFFDQIFEQSDNRENLLYQFDVYYFKVRPKISSQTMRLLIYGNLSKTVAEQYVTQFPSNERKQQSFIRHKPQGLLILMSDHKKAPLVSVSAV